MSQLLHRTVGNHTVSGRSPDGGIGLPTKIPEIERLPAPRWPQSFKVVVAVLGALAVAGVFGTAVQYFGDDDAVSDAEGRIAELTEQRDELLAENGELSNDVAGLASDNAQLGTELAEISTELETVQLENAAISTELETVQLENAAIANELATVRLDKAAIASELEVVQLENTTIATELEAATARVGDLTDQVGNLQVTIDSVTAERDALVAMFPMIVDTSLVGVDVTGTYAVEWSPAYNSGLADIALPHVSQIVIGHTVEGWVQIAIPGVVTADLSRSDGALFTMVDTTTAVPPIDGVARTARVAITIYAGETVTTSNGITSVSELGMSVAISTPASGGAPAGVALYGAELVPQN